MKFQLACIVLMEIWIEISQVATVHSFLENIIEEKNKNVESTFS